MSEDQAPSYGIDETKELLKFTFEMVNGYSKAVEDRKFDLSDLVHFVSPLLGAEKAFSGISKVPKELADLDKAESDALNTWFGQEFDIGNDKLEETVKRFFKVGIEIMALVSHLRGN